MEPEGQRPRPIAGAMAVVVKDLRILLIRRRNPPDEGRWSFPAGKINYGERVDQAAVRELFEETAVCAEPLRFLDAVDAIDFDENGNVQHHFIIVAVSCIWRSGVPKGGDDALEARWFSIDEVERLDLSKSFDVLSLARSSLSSKHSYDDSII